MMRFAKVNTLVLGLGLCLGATASLQAATYFVDDDASGNGTSWQNAWPDLQQALTYELLDDYDVILVAQGTYKPTNGNDPNVAFNLVDGVTVEGGYAGYYTGDPQQDPDERDIEQFETILSGYINGDRSYHVVRSNPSDPQKAERILDGFTITGGSADGTGTGRQQYGGGILVENAPTTIIRCTIKNNLASWPNGFGGEGGGMAVFASGAELDDDWYKIIDCTFQNNHAELGGGALFVNEFAGCIILNSLFYWNTATGEDLARGRGGAVDIYADAAETRVVNCTFTGNESKGCEPEGPTGGAFWLGTDSSVDMDNCIVWGNLPDQFDGEGGGSLAVDYSDVEMENPEDVWPGTGNINADPEFRDPDGVDDVPGTGDDDYRLKPTSPCIDAGDNSPFNEDENKDRYDLDADSDFDEATPDLDITDRIVDHEGGLIVDMGAYESDLCPGDVNLDGFVDIEDIFAVLAAWGPCQDCPEDIDDSGVVDIDDLFAVLANWGCGDPDPGGPPQNIMDCILRYASDPEDLAACIEAMTLTGSN